MVYAKLAEFPPMIDFGEFNLYESHFYDHSDTWTWKLGEEGYRLGLTAFNGAPELGAFLAYLKNAAHIDTVVETGTFQGHTTHFFAKCFKEVHTIEIDDELFQRAKIVFQDQPQVHCHLGSSEKVLRELLPSLQDRAVVFYLDAHWYDWPMFDELDAISKTHKNRCVLIIDDCKVPGRPDIGFDGYEIDGEYYECSYASLKKYIDRVLTDYTVHYLIPENGRARAKLVVLPKTYNFN